MKTLSLGLLYGAILVLAPSAARAAPVWSGDFETGDLSQWSFILNGQVNGMDYAFAQSDMTLEGMFAGRIELHNNAVWPNGLKRVELQHRPEDARTAEGATTWFAWSFYLPEALPPDSTQEIGYWESANSFQQMMAFQVIGQNIAFFTRRPNNVEQWQADGLVTPGQWHRIAFGVTWSTDPGQGTVDVWFDGEQVVDQASAQTLADNNPHLVQIGLLRPVGEFQDVPVIILDDAVEGDSVEDVRPDDLPGGVGDTGGSTGGGSGADTSGGMGGDTTGQPPGGSSGGGGETGMSPPSPTSGGVDSNGSGNTSSGPGGSVGGADGGDDGGASGCSCRSARTPAGVWALVLLAMGGGARRRTRRTLSRG